MTPPLGPDPTELLTLRQVGDHLGISEDSVLRLVQGGRLARTNVGTGQRSRTRIQRSEVWRFIEANTSTARTAPGRRGLRAAG